MAATEFSDEVADLIWKRDLGSCAKCGRGLRREERGGAWAIHHRAPRGQGGAGVGEDWINLAANGVCLCASCHDEIESERAVARATGFIVPRRGIIRSTDVAIRHAAFGWVRLDNAGGMLDGFEPEPTPLALREAAPKALAA